MSQEIIKVLEYLCMKFGIVVDWSNESVIPYVKELAIRYCTFRSQWCLVGIITGIVCFVVALVLFIVYLKTREDAAAWFAVIAIIVGCVLFFMSMYGYLKCNNVPEMLLYEYIQTLK